ncbi:hypothetical protein T4B_2936 [Trichinella pseudospiralis]|uniref:Uncharacterized protein n=1 Tax=Trichinella pseudospiralis TaxID=6337 RepID=A0A0V1J6C1_TRIPS|nr:hypothetical protein T4B_2936 [Trichinella pseudospiralis]
MRSICESLKHHISSRETHVNDRLYSYISHTDVTIGSLTTAVNPTDSDESKVISVSLKTMNNVVHQQCKTLFNYKQPLLIAYSKRRQFVCIC